MNMKDRWTHNHTNSTRNPFDELFFLHTEASTELNGWGLSHGKK